MRKYSISQVLHLLEKDNSKIFVDEQGIKLYCKDDIIIYETNKQLNIISVWKEVVKPQHVTCFSCKQSFTIYDGELTHSCGLKDRCCPTGVSLKIVFKG